MASDNGNGKRRAGHNPVTVYWLTPAEISERYPTQPYTEHPRERWRANRRRNRAAGVDRFGRPLPREAGTNPRALRGDA